MAMSHHQGHTQVYSFQWTRKYFDSFQVLFLRKKNKEVSSYGCTDGGHSNTFKYMSGIKGTDIKHSSESILNFLHTNIY